ncbi:hypothetical protein ACN27F_06410 [Solwaraspora sp. WMMB335]|uniref:hypothetical protein n=1 Tax=Solwaraspora sp. WMMB335 TaxID=3404118 RepID=UPI003B9458BE
MATDRTGADLAVLTPHGEEPVETVAGETQIGATRAALVTGADVVSVPTHLADQVLDGIGAVLRYA